MSEVSPPVFLRRLAYTEILLHYGYDMPIICYVLKDASNENASRLIRQGIVEAGWEPSYVPQRGSLEFGWNLGNAAMLYVEETERPTVWIAWKKRLYRIEKTVRLEFPFQFSMNFGEILLSQAPMLKLDIKAILVKIGIRIEFCRIAINIALTLTITLTIAITLILCITLNSSVPNIETHHPPHQRKAY